MDILTKTDGLLSRQLTTSTFWLFCIPFGVQEISTTHSSPSSKVPFPIQEPERTMSSGCSFANFISFKTSCPFSARKIRAASYFEPITASENTTSCEGRTSKRTCSPFLGSLIGSTGSIFQESS